MTGPRRPLRIHRLRGPRGRHEISVARLAAGYESGFWDENGVPAPWPKDFNKPGSGWTFGSPSYADRDLDGEPPVDGEPPF